jgi:hypothetical protein
VEAGADYLATVQGRLGGGSCDMKLICLLSSRSNYIFPLRRCLHSRNMALDALDRVYWCWEFVLEV